MTRVLFAFIQNENCRVTFFFHKRILRLHNTKRIDEIDRCFYVSVLLVFSDVEMLQATLALLFIATLSCEYTHSNSFSLRS